MVQTEIVALILTGIGIIISILYYTMNLKNANETQQQQLETRQANLFSQYHLYYQSKEFQHDFNEILYKWEWKDYEEFRTKYGSGSENLKAYSSWIRIFQFYDGLGVLVKKGLLDENLVAELMSDTLKLFWEKNITVIRKAREYHNLPTVFEMTEYLYNEVSELENPE